jgi:NAD(P)-dependent dehydrogenase (short-subunit alcohol dehydrogenase family)
VKLDNKVAVVTGAATGLGRATAIGAAKEGAQLVLADIDEDGGEATAKLISGAGGTAHFVRTDLSQSADVRRLMDTVGERYGHLDILINPAAILVDAGTRIDEYSEESWRRVIDVNLTGSFLLLKYAVPLLQQAGGGVVLLVISGAGVLGGSASLPYGSSKGGVRGLVLVAREQLRPLNIRIHAVSPGEMATNMKLGAIREMAEKAGRSADEAERESRPGLSPPEDSAAKLIDLASDAGAAAGDAVTIFDGDWDIETHSLRIPSDRRLQ